MVMRQGPALSGLAAFALLALAARPAWALEGCPGSFVASALQPLPSPLVVALDIANDSPQNQALSQSFANGLQAAGVQIGSPSTARLGVTYNMIGGGSGGGSGGDAPWDYSDNSAFQGGVARQLPAFPSSDMFSPSSPPQNSLLILRIDVHNAQTNELDWVAPVQCSMQSGDSQQLAYDLGYLVGTTIGQRVQNRPL